MFELIKDLFKKNAAILGMLPPKSLELIMQMKKPGILVTDRIFFLVMHDNKVPPKTKNIMKYAEKHIFGMPVKVVSTEDWNASKKMQMLMPYNTVLFIDLDKHE